ncbi:MAG: SPOR domain-containing protein [Prevotella sp.]|nr:SPOR domain-containing protein [Prevotella sp.]MBR6494809.1 SPOR domain-containing protein [Prevotella sp.]
MEKRHQIIKRVLSILPLYFFTFLPLSAQSYLEHLQQKTLGLGIVSVHQSKEIDDLVNGTVPVTELENKTEEVAKERIVLKPDMPKTEVEGNAEAEVDMSKKVMRNGYKTTGFRVQAFAGGNSREDKRKAEEARDKIKRAYPSEPVYVHFYSPRWTCRVGNYRTQEEANRMLRNIRNLGYRQAVVVKGKITVQY